MNSLKPPNLPFSYDLLFYLICFYQILIEHQILVICGYFSENITFEYFNRHAGYFLPKPKTSAKKQHNGNFFTYSPKNHLTTLVGNQRTYYIANVTLLIKLNPLAYNFQCYTPSFLQTRLPKLGDSILSI